MGLRPDQTGVLGAEQSAAALSERSMDDVMTDRIKLVVAAGRLIDLLRRHFHVGELPTTTTIAFDISCGSLSQWNDLEIDCFGRLASPCKHTAIVLSHCLPLLQVSEALADIFKCNEKDAPKFFYLFERLCNMHWNTSLSATRAAESTYQLKNNALVRTDAPTTYACTVNIELAKVDSQFVSDLEVALDDAGQAGFGPLPPDEFCFGGKSVSISRPMIWKLLNVLWHAKGKFVETTSLAEPVWGDHAETETKSKIGHLRSDTNRFFEEHGFPFKISVKNDFVRLLETDK